MRRFAFWICTTILSMAFLLTIISCGGPKITEEPSAHDLFVKGKQLYEKGKYISAQERFKAVVYNYPGAAVVDTAQYFLALSYYGNKEYTLAGIEFNRLTLNYPSSPYFEQSIFMKAVSFFESTPKHYALDQSDLVTAIKQFEDFIVDFPESEVIPDAQEYLKKARTRLARKYYQNGITYSRIGAYRAAKMYFQQVIDDFTDTKYGPLAVYQKAEMDYHIKAYKEARTGFENFALVFSDHELVKKAGERAAKSAFLNCKSLFEQGKLDSASECFEEFQNAFPADKHVGKAQKYFRKALEQASQGSSKENVGT